MPEQEMLHEGEPGVRLLTLGHNNGRNIIAIHMHELDNSLSLGFLSVVIVKDFHLTFDFPSGMTV